MNEKHVLRAFGGLSLALALLAGQSVSALTNVWWTGGAGNGLWSDAGNWNTNRAPAGTDTVRLGYPGTGEVADVAQNINLDVDSTVHELYFHCEGDRTVSLDGGGTHTITITKFGSASFSVIRVEGGADSDASVDNLTLQYAGSGDFFLFNYTTNVFRLGPGTTLDRGSGAFQTTGGGNWRIQNTIGFYWRMRDAGTVYLDGAALSGTQADAPIDMVVESDSSLPYMVAVAFIPAGGRVHSITRGGAGDRTLTMNLTIKTGGNAPVNDWTSNNVEVIENTQDDGHLTLRTDYWRILTYNILTDEDTTVELYNGGNRRMDFGVLPGVTGPGDVHMNMDSAGQAFTLRRPLGHTGSTMLYTGILSVGSHYVDPGNDDTGSDFYPEGTYYGSLSSSSAVYIASTASLDLNGQTNTVDGLSGVGSVVLDGGKLISTGGMSPGDSVGSQSINGNGAVEITGGTSTFEINAVDDYDQVIIGDADLVIGGTLNVIVNGAMSQDLYTDYIIFSLTNGTATGEFTDFTDNVNGYATVDIVNGTNVVLTLNEPAGTAIMIR